MSDCLDCKYIKDIGEIGLCLTHTRKTVNFRVYCKLYMRKWRAANPERARELTKAHGYTWRQKHPELNRLRARLGARKIRARLKGVTTNE